MRNLKSQSRKVKLAISNAMGEDVTFDYVVKRYAVTKEQLKSDMKGLRWKNVGGVIYFDLKQIRKVYQVDTDKLSVLATLEANQRE
jgi:hypothetical protein